MSENEIRAFNEGIEAAAAIAQPAYHKKKPGAWSALRKRLADEIRACKLENMSS